MQLFMTHKNVSRLDTTSISIVFLSTELYIRTICKVICMIAYYSIKLHFNVFSVSLVMKFKIANVIKVLRLPQW